MSPDTHRRIDHTLCGTPLEIGPGMSRVDFEALPNMAVDETGLIHGGFVFGLADYAAMIAVNHPNVVLGGAEVKFLKPVGIGDRLTARADVEQTVGKKHTVRVGVMRDGDTVFDGTFICFVLDKHVMAETQMKART